MFTFSVFVAARQVDEQVAVGDYLVIELEGVDVVAPIVSIEEDAIVVAVDGTGEQLLSEATYQGRDVPLNKPMKGDVKKSKVFVKNAQGNVVKVNFGDKNLSIKKHIPARRSSFRARHNCDNPGPKTKARYWSCRAW